MFYYFLYLHLSIFLTISFISQILYLISNVLVGTILIAVFSKSRSSTWCSPGRESPPW